MALQRDTLYPGRFDTGDSAHPQGAFRNRTTPTGQDGSYLEEQWLNDWDGFFASLLNKAGLTPDGNVDAVGASQYFAALQSLVSGNYVSASGTANVITLADTSITAYTDGMPLRFKVSLANTGVTTLNVNGVGAVTVYGSAGLACQGGELAPGLATVVYSSALSGFVIVHCTGANKQVPDATQSHHAVSKAQLDKALSTPVYVTVSAISNTLVFTLPAGTVLTFRNPTLVNGTPIKIKTSSDLTYTVPQGATLGTVNGVLANIIPVVFYNGGNPVLGASNLDGGLDLSESNLLSATAISSSATSSSVVYASSVVTSSPYVVCGLVKITETVAGTWATAPSLVVPKGTNLVSTLSGLGYVQKWQNLTAARAASTTYYNTTGKPIYVSVLSMIYDAGLSLYIDGIMVSTCGQSEGSGNDYNTVAGIVPPDSSYRVTVPRGTITAWLELR